MTYVLTVFNQGNILPIITLLKWQRGPIISPIAGIVAFADAQINLMKCKFLKMSPFVLIIVFFDVLFYVHTQSIVQVRVVLEKGVQ